MDIKSYTTITLTFYNYSIFNTDGEKFINKSLKELLIDFYGENMVLSIENNLNKNPQFNKFNLNGTITSVRTESTANPAIDKFYIALEINPMVKNKYEIYGAVNALVLTLQKTNPYDMTRFFYYAEYQNDTYHKYEFTREYSPHAAIISIFERLQEEMSITTNEKDSDYWDYIFDWESTFEYPSIKGDW